MAKRAKIESGMKRFEKIKNYLGVVFIDDKITEKRLIWFGYVKRRSNTTSIQSILD